MKQYLVSEEELRKFGKHVSGDEEYIEVTLPKIIKNFLKSKKPVEVIVEGKVVIDERGHIKIGKEYSITIDYALGEVKGKKVKIILEEE